MLPSWNCAQKQLTCAQQKAQRTAESRLEHFRTGYCNESATDIQTRIACVDSRDWMERMRMEHTKRVGKRRSRTRPGDCGASVRCLSSERRPRRGECCAKAGSATCTVSL